MTNKTPYKYHVRNRHSIVPPSEYYTDDRRYSDGYQTVSLYPAVQREIVDGNLFIRSLLKAMRTKSNRYDIHKQSPMQFQQLSCAILFSAWVHFSAQLRTRRVVKVYFISCKCNPINSLSYMTFMFTLIEGSCSERTVCI